MNVKSSLACALVAAVALLSGCGTVPFAPPETDARAKLLQAVPGKAVVYLFRNETYSAPWPIRVSLDGQDMGQSGADTYFRWTVEPGEHLILSHTENVASLILNAEAGRVYYVWQDVEMGFFQPRSRLTPVDRSTTEIALRSSYLLESKI
jgi:Protein of unknown function (DUF2846)